MSLPTVSVVITTRNRPQLVVRALRSALGQTYPNYDVHLVDDASEDDVSEAVKALTGGPRVSYWRHEQRRGLSAARNTGMARSQGEYVAFLDDDDEWKPDNLHRRISLLPHLASEERRKLGVIYCGCEVHIPIENRITYVMPKIHGNIKQAIRASGLSTIPSSCLFPRRVLDQVGGFDESLCSSIDHDIWMSLAAHGFHAGAVNEPLVVTYETRNRTSMVTDVAPRIQGVEQYLAKWRGTLAEWLGATEAEKYIQAYRTRVLGGLAGQRLAAGAFRECRQLCRNVIARNGLLSGQTLVLGRLLARYTIRRFTPAILLRLRDGARGRSF